MSVFPGNRRTFTVLTTLALTAATAAAAPTSWAGGSTSGPASAVSRAAANRAAVAPALQTSTATLVRKTLLSQLNPPVPDSTGIAYLGDLDRLVVVDSEVDELPIYQGVNLWQIARPGTPLVDTGNTRAYSREPTGIAYDPVGQRVFISDDDQDRVFVVTAGPDNRLGTADDPVTSFSTLAFGDDDAEDVAYDTTSGDLFVVQANAATVWRVSRGANGVFDGVAPTGDDVVSHFDVGVYGSVDVEGITYSPTRDSLFLADRAVAQVFEVTKSGALVQSIDVAGIHMFAPAGITLAPSTTDPSRTSLYVVDRGKDNNTYPNENDGTMWELSAPDLAPVTPSSNQAPVVSAGPDREVTLPESAVLNGTVTDDGRPQPPGATTATWSQASGPGTVTFAHPHDAATSVGFSSAGTYVLRLSATDSALTMADEVEVVVHAGSGPASGTCRGTSARIQVGPSTNDLLVGTGGVDLLRGERGNDTLLGRGGGDCLEGGSGKDTLRGQRGDDDLVGNGGADKLSGGAGADRIDPGAGKDTVNGGGGNDRIFSVDGKRDIVRCGSGVDRVVADGLDQVTSSCEHVKVK